MAELAMTGTYGAATGTTAAVRAAAQAEQAQYLREFNNYLKTGQLPGYSMPTYSNDTSNLSDPTAYIQAAKDLAEYNTAQSQALAREQMRFQEQANAKAMDFNAEEALKTRDWQTMMSNTAHQREVADLVAAGLNPVLSANQGAAVGSAANATGVTSSGAKGSVDTSVVNALTSLYMKAADMEMQDKNLAMQQKQIDAQVLMNALTNDTNRYAATKSSDATVAAAGMNSSAHRYAADLDYATWSQGLHNQYAQLGEWIYKALSGLDFSNLFNLGFDFNGLFGNKEPARNSGYHVPNYQDTPREIDYGTKPGRTQMHYLEMLK